nr:hypothetical protein [Tanacetum cinerariifolium]
MDGPDLTMEEYIELEAENAHRPIVYNVALTSASKILSEPMIEQLDNNIDYNVDTQSHEFKENFETNHDIHGEPSDMEGYLIIIKVMIQMRFHEGMPLIFIIKDLYVPFGILFDPKRFYKDGICTRKLRRLRRIHQVQVLDFEGLTKEMAMSIDARLSMEYIDTQGHVIFTSHTWRRLFKIKGLLVRELMLEFFSTCRFVDTMLDLEDAGYLTAVVQYRQDWGVIVLQGNSDVVDLFKVSCVEEKLEDNETHLLDLTLVVLTPPFDVVISLVDTSVSKEVAYNVIPPPKLLLRRGPLLMFRARPLLLKNPRTRRSQFYEGFDAGFVFYFQCTPCCRNCGALCEDSQKGMHSGA